MSWSKSNVNKHKETAMGRRINNVTVKTTPLEYSGHSLINMPVFGLLLRMKQMRPDVLQLIDMIHDMVRILKTFCTFAVAIYVSN